MGVKKKLVKTILDADNAKRLKRAADQGFDKDLYHATFSDFDQFKQGYRGASGNETAKIGHWFSDTPDGTSGFWTRESDDFLPQIDPDTGDFKRWDDGDLMKFRADDEIASIMPLKANIKKPLVFESDGKDDAFEKFMDWRDQWAKYGSAELDNKSGSWRKRMIAEKVGDTNDSVRKFLDDNGYDAIELRGTKYDAPEGETINQFVIPYGKEQNIRSVNAKFDPANIGKNDIMGSVDPKVMAALGVAGAGAALASPDAEAGVKKKIADTILDPDNAKRALKKRQAYHGTPHDFDAFDLKKIGTGEGAQAYGHGLYFSSNKGIAKGYRDALSKGYTKITGPDGNIIPSDQLASKLRKTLDDKYASTASTKDMQIIDDVVQQMDRGLRDGDDLAHFKKFVEQSDWDAKEKEIYLTAIGEAENYSALTNPGKLYTVDIPDESHMLDWDKPLSEQPEVVRKVVNDLGERGELWGVGEPLDLKSDPSGREVHNAIARIEQGRMEPTASSSEVGHAATSAKLKELGIPGITYKGATSDERNFVVFDDSLVDIKEKGFIDPKVLAALGLGTAVANQPGAGNYAAALLQGIGHMPKMMTEELARFGGYANSGLHQILSGKSSPFPVENVDRDAKAMNDWYWKMAEKSALTPTIYNRLNEKAATEALNPKTEAAKANILQGAGGFANQLIEEVGPTREGQAIKSAYNTLMPIYRKLPKALRGLIESI